jgi:hypothetical protein
MSYTITVTQAAKFDTVRLQTQYNTCTMNLISFLVTNLRRSQNILLAVNRQSLTNHLLTVKQSWSCGLPQCDTLHSDTNVAEKHAVSAFNVKVILTNVREAKWFTTYGTRITSSCRTQSYVITKTTFYSKTNLMHNISNLFYLGTKLYTVCVFF